jgi:hypothetical protein
MESDEAGPRLTAGAVARRLGVAVTTLRTWDQRYGLGPTERQAGKHRRYGVEDVQRLELMRRLTFEGIAPGEAARVALAVPGSELLVTASPTPRSSGSGTIPAGRAQAGVRGLVRAATGLDADAVTEVVRSSLRAFGTVATWNDVLVPVLTAFGRRFEEGQRVVDAEHFLSWHISSELRRVTSAALATRSASVLLMSAPDEQHTLALEALAASLRELRHPSRMLGARVPVAAAVAAVTRTAPAVVVVWSQVPSTAVVALFERLQALGTSRLVAIGPGWRGTRLPTGVLRPGSLVEAIGAVEGATEGPAPSSRHADLS